MGDIRRYIQDYQTYAPDGDAAGVSYAGVPAGIVVSKVSRTFQALNDTAFSARQLVRQTGLTALGGELRYTRRLTQQDNGYLIADDSLTATTEFPSNANMSAFLNEAWQVAPKVACAYGTFVTDILQHSLCSMEVSTIRVTLDENTSDIIDGVYGGEQNFVASKSNAQGYRIEVLCTNNDVGCKQYVQLCVSPLLGESQNRTVLGQFEAYGIRPTTKVHTFSLFVALDETDRSKFRARVKVNNFLVIDGEFTSPYRLQPIYKERAVIKNIKDMQFSINTNTAWGVGPNQSREPSEYEPLDNHVCKFVQASNTFFDGDIYNNRGTGYKTVNVNGTLRLTNKLQERYTPTDGSRVTDRHYQLFVVGDALTKGTSPVYPTDTTNNRLYIKYAGINIGDGNAFLQEGINKFGAKFPVFFVSDSTSDVNLLCSEPRIYNPNQFVRGASALQINSPFSAYALSYTEGQQGGKGEVRGVMGLDYESLSPSFNFGVRVDYIGLLVTDYFIPDDIFENPTAGCPNGVPPNERPTRDFNPQRLGDSVKFAKRLRGSKATDVLNQYFTDIQDLLRFYVDKDKDYAKRIGTIIDGQGFRITNTVNEIQQDAKVKT